MELSSGKIFLAEQRGVIETELAIKYCTFNSDNFYNEHKQSFGSLNLLNDEVLAGSAALKIQIPESTYMIIIPVTGDVVFQEDQSEPLPITVGQVLIKSILAGNSISITNPYKEDEINFIRIGIKSSNLEYPNTNIIPVDLIANRDKLITVAPLNKDNPLKFPFRLSIGQFSGRYDFNYRMMNRSNNFFSFVLAGAFEAEGRLLHPRDGLALWNINEVEIEALSDHATLLNLEFDDGLVD